MTRITDIPLNLAAGVILGIFMTMLSFKLLGMISLPWMLILFPLWGTGVVCLCLAVVIVWVFMGSAIWEGFIRRD